MPTQIVYASGADGYVYGHDNAYATARSTAFAAFAGSLRIGQTFQTPSYECMEAFTSFDTSLVANPIGATLSLYSSADFSLVDFIIEARLLDYGTTLETGDYVAGASISQTLLATYDTTAGFAAGAYYAFTEVALLANLNLSGFTRILLNSSRHRLNNTPTDTEWVEAYESGYPGTTQDPKLVIDNDVGNPGLAGPDPDDEVEPPFMRMRQ